MNRTMWSLMLLLATPVSARGEESLPELVKRVKPAVVTVVSFNPAKGMPSLGTGFFVAPDRIVSARHVLAAADRAEVRTAAGVTLRVAGILAEDRLRDLVLFQVDKPPTPPAILPLATDQPDAGERVFTLGTPLGLEWSVSTGVVAACRDVPDAARSCSTACRFRGQQRRRDPELPRPGGGRADRHADRREGDDFRRAGPQFCRGRRHAAALKAGNLRPLAQCRRTCRTLVAGDHQRTSTS